MEVLQSIGQFFARWLAQLETTFVEKQRLIILPRPTASMPNVATDLSLMLCVVLSGLGTKATCHRSSLKSMVMPSNFNTHGDHLWSAFSAKTS